MGDDPDVSVVIVHYNTTELTTRCVESIFSTGQHVRVALEVLVIDNGSDADTLGPLGARRPVRVARLARAGGLSRAWNLGVELTRGRHVLLLNSDIVFVEEAIAPLADFLDRTPRAAAVGPQLFLDPECRQIQVSCSGIFTLRTALWEHSALDELFPANRVLGDFYLADWKRDTQRKVETVAGAAFMAKREIFADLRFDERYRFFYEEPDFARQLQARGWDTYYLPQVRLVHSRSGTLRTIAPYKVWLLTLESMCKYIQKHYGWAAMVLVCVVAAVNLPFKWLLKKALGDRSGWKRCVAPASPL